MIFRRFLDTDTMKFRTMSRTLCSIDTLIGFLWTVNVENEVNLFQKIEQISQTHMFKRGKKNFFVSFKSSSIVEDVFSVNADV